MREIKVFSLSNMWKEEKILFFQKWHISILLFKINEIFSFLATRIFNLMKLSLSYHLNKHFKRKTFCNINLLKIKYLDEKKLFSLQQHSDSFAKLKLNNNGFKNYTYVILLNSFIANTL